jgi:S-(hydroxymethyl)glutathione dehydrogenase/alcohol dehydrogenase
VRADGSLRLSKDGAAIVQFVGLSGFADEMLVNQRSVARIPQDMPFEVAAVLGCAVSTGVGAVRHTAKVGFGQTVAVIGCGGVGLNVIQGAALSGASRIIAVDCIPEKLELAKRFGATDIVDAGQVDAVEAVRALTGDGVDHALEVIGLPATIEQAFAMLRPMGTATVVGLARPDAVLSLPAGQLLFERKLQGSRIGGTRVRLDIPQYAEMYMAGRLELDALVSRHIELAQLDEALVALDSPVGARSVIQFG